MEKLTKEQIDNLPEWMPVEGFPNYEVNCRAGIIRNIRTLRVLKQNPNKDKYPQVGLYKDGKEYTNRVHRIVANAAFNFYNISTDGLCVCHLDEERHNPRIDNLAIGTIKENLAFPKAKKRLSQSHKGYKGYWLGKSFSEGHRKKISEAITGEKNPLYGKHHSEETIKKMSKRVGAYKDGKLIMVFQGTREAGRNGFNPSHISACCTGRRRVHKGYVWKCI